MARQRAARAICPRRAHRRELLPMACRLALVLVAVASISVVTGHKGKCCNRAAKLKRKKIVFKKELSECKEPFAEKPMKVRSTDEANMHSETLAS